VSDRQLSSNYKIALFSSSFKSFKEAKELFISNVEKLEIDVTFLASDNHSIKQEKFNELKLKSIVRKFHALYHDAQLWHKRNLTIAYKLRALSTFGSKTQQIKSQNFMGLGFSHNYKIKNYFIRAIANKYCISLLHIFIHQLLFRFQYLISDKSLFNFDAFIFLYGGRISAEEDFLIWVSNYKGIDSIAIQENWDNLSSKKFLFQHPKTFITWGAQSTFHLRKFHNFRGEVRELGSLRLQQFYQFESINRVVSSRVTSSTDEIIKNDVLKILLIGTGDGTHDSDLLRSTLKFVSHLSAVAVKNYVFIYRPHPFTRNAIKNDQLLEYKGKIVVEIPQLDESNSYRLNLLKEASIVISLYSTVILEASILNKVTIIPSFIAAKYEYSTYDFLYESAHFMGLKSLNNLHNFATEIDYFNFLLNFTGIKPDKNRLSYVNFCCSNIDTSRELLQLLSEKAKEKNDML